MTDLWGDMITEEGRIKDWMVTPEWLEKLKAHQTDLEQTIINLKYLVQSDEALDKNLMKEKLEAVTSKVREWDLTHMETTKRRRADCLL